MTDLVSVLFGMAISVVAFFAGFFIGWLKDRIGQGWF